MAFTGVLTAQKKDNWGVFVSGIEFELFDKGFKQLDNGRHEEAVETFKQLIQRQPLKISPYFSLAGIYCQLERYAEAVEIYEKMLHLFPIEIRKLGSPSSKNPIYSQFYYNLGIAYLKLNRTEDAVTALKRAVKKRSYKLTHSAILLKCYPASALEFRPFFAELHYQLGIAYLALGNQDAAMKQYKQIKKLDKEKAAEFQKQIVI